MDWLMPCDGGRMVLEASSLDGIWQVIAWVLFVLVIAFALISFWISPVAAPLSTNERRLTGRGRLYAMATLSILSIAVLATSLALTIVPVSCATQAYLVSSHVPPGVSDWSDRTARFRREQKDMAIAADRTVLDLGPVRNQVLDQLPQRVLTPADEVRIPALVRAALTDFNRGRLPDTALRASGDRGTRFEPRLVESIELAVLMAWRAQHAGEDHRIGYIVGNRAEAYQWKWDIVARRFGTTQTNKRIAIFETVGETVLYPRLDRIATASRTADDTQISIVVLIDTPADGTITLDVQDGTGNVLATEDLVLVRRSARQMERMVFTAADLSDAVRLVQRDPVDDRTLASALLPPLRHEPVLLHVYSPNDTRQTIRFLTSGTGTCHPDTPAHRNAATAWEARYGNTVGMTDLPRQSDVILYHRQPDDAILIVPTLAWIDPGASTIVFPPPLPFMGDRSVNDAFATVGNDANADVLVLQSRSSGGARLSPHRLGASAAGMSSVPAFEVENNVEKSDTNLFATLNKRIELGYLRLTPDAYATVTGPLEQRAYAPYLTDSNLHSTAAGISAGPELIGALCSGVTEAEMFYGYWAYLFDRIIDAATPRMRQVAGAPTRDPGVPEIIFSQPDLQAIAAKRMELPVLVALAVMGLFLSLMASAYIGAARIDR